MKTELLPDWDNDEFSRHTREVWNEMKAIPLETTKLCKTVGWPIVIPIGSLVGLVIFVICMI